MRTFLILLLPAFLSAQKVEFRHGDRSLPFNDGEWFKTAPKPTSWADWSSYGRTWDGKQVSIWALFAGAGVLHGMREAYHADPYVFETNWGVASTSFFGSDAWKRNYRNNDPDQPHKHEILGNFGRDVWHTNGTLHRGMIITGTFAIGARKHQPLKYRILNTLIALGVHSTFANITYQTLR